MPVSLYRFRTLWTGFQGAPGYTNMFFATDTVTTGEATSLAASIRTFWLGVANLIPSDITLQIQADVQLQDAATSKVNGSLTIAQPAAVTPLGSGAYSAPTGASMTWHTGIFFNGREIKGRTYLVPLIGTAYEADGTLTASAQSSMSDAGSALITATGIKFVVRSPASQAASGGAAAHIASVAVKDTAAVLRSRRD